MTPPKDLVADGAKPPNDLVVMGRIAGPFGVKGWVKLQPFTAAPKSLVAYASWWIESDKGWEPREVELSEVHGQSLAAKFAGCDGRDAAAVYRGRQVAIPRAAFAAAGENEFYWADLVGLKVVNAQGEDFGTVSAVFETGANDVLVVEGPAVSPIESPNESKRERLIPFTEQVVRQVDLTGRVIRVDWGADY